MPETNSKGQRLISVVRVIEYHGTDEWIQATLSAGRVPIQGNFQGKLPEGCSIKSGAVVWAPDEGVDEVPKAVIPIPPGSTSIM